MSPPDPSLSTPRTRKLRAKRVAKGICSSCLKNPVGSPAKDLCAGCYVEHINYLRRRYEERRAAGQCVQCGAPAGGAYLCEKHAAARRKRRQRTG